MDGGGQQGAGDGRGRPGAVGDDPGMTKEGGGLRGTVVRNALKLLFEMLVGLIWALVCAVYWE